MNEERRSRGSYGFSQLVVPCCDTPMVDIDDLARGPRVQWVPENEVVQCLGCGAVWGPLPEPARDAHDDDDDDDPPTDNSTFLVGKLGKELDE